MKWFSLPSALLCLALCSMFCCTAARADFVEYQILGTPLTMLLEGTATYTGKTIILRHPKFGSLYFPNSTRVHRVPSTYDQYAKKLNAAKTKQDAAFTMEVARWALKHGLLKNFHQAVDLAKEHDGQNVEVARIEGLRAKMAVDLGDHAEQEKALRKFCRKRDMKVTVSEHFILLHDTPDKPAEGRHKPRAEERLELLEMVYETFLFTFYARGVQLEVPRERLMVVLFNEYDDFRAFADELSPELASAAGFFIHDQNISVFFDHSTKGEMEALTRLAQRLEVERDRAIKLRSPGVADIRRFSDTISLLVEVTKENYDIEVVSHEATHHMAANTGLLPRHVRIPSWVHEGLATYFEAPDEAVWAGVGAVNRERLDLYRALEHDRVHSNIDFIVGDQIFNFAASNGATLHGYGQAWALTHFLMEKRFDDFMKFYRRLGEMPPDVMLSPELLTRIFDETFGKDRRALDSQWRAYMRSLKTDADVVLENR
ncbi:MAG: DUF1570 domain-containing protein [Pirellulaceae bacterium]